MVAYVVAYLAGAVTMLTIAVTIGARWRRKRRKADEAHAAMLLAVWDVQDAVADAEMDPPINAVHRQAAISDLEELRQARNTAARRYFAAVGE